MNNYKTLEFLMDQGFDLSHRGTNYLAYYLDEIGFDPQEKLTRDVYPRIAKHYGTNAASIERCIRTCKRGTSFEHFKNCELMARIYFRYQKFLESRK